MRASMRARPGPAAGEAKEGARGPQAGSVWKEMEADGVEEAKEGARGPQAGPLFKIFNAVCHRRASRRGGRRPSPAFQVREDGAARPLPAAPASCSA